MNAKELRKKEQEAADIFFKKFKENFDISRLEQESHSHYSYDKWHFENVRSTDSINEFRVYYKKDYNDQFPIRGNRRFRKRLKWFLIEQIENRKELERVRDEAAKLEVVQTQIVTDFPSDTTETFNTLNEGGK